ncbi:hypothetical protein GCM10011509_21130 [Ornithinimicrobium pekingense]|uniref:Galactosyltransferase C-terminal domain-containing protein n=2 Tax=Ornithinimicrobium pekingense TaxID=384677 RepID=A0ABQ2FCI3_9MICO|nr:hypothetical protein GCM10011509_21130 [Ornithinimicrobium pekingense]
MAKGRHEHLLGQVDGLSVGSVPPVVHSVVSMGDRDLTRGRLPLGTDRWRTVVRPVQSDRRALPLAQARNAAAEAAVEEGADLLVFMGGDVIPGKRALERYADAVTTGAPDGVSGPVVWQGPLLHLPPLENEALGYPFGHLAEIATPTGSDPVLEPGQLLHEPDWGHFRGCAFAMTARDFADVGGFCPDYTGHGLEDADFARKVGDAGGSLVWVGGAASYLQPVPAPDTADELRIALRHAATWRARWGTDPDHPMIDRLLGAGVLQRAETGGYVAV